MTQSVRSFIDFLMLVDVLNAPNSTLKYFIIIYKRSSAKKDKPLIKETKERPFKSQTINYV